MAYPYNVDYEAAAKERVHKEPVLQTNRSVWKLIILDFLTLGIYSIFFFIPFSFDIDKVAPRRDGGRTFNYLFAYILALFTAKIALFCWFHQITERVEQALTERNIDYDLSIGHFWGWYVLGSYILVGPYVYYYKLCKAMNLLCEDFNEKNQTK